MADKKEDGKVVAAEDEKHDGALSDPTVAETLKSWTEKNAGKVHTLQDAAETTASK